MKSCLKLSIAAVLFGAMILSSSAFAAAVENGSDAKVTAGGIVWANTGYYQPAEGADGEAPPATLEIAHETRLNVAASYGSVTANWQYWIRDKIGGQGDVIMGWVTWMPSEALQIDMGSVQDPSWSERAVDWETHLAVDSVGAPGAYNYLFPEGSRGTDITFRAGGGISVGVLLSDKGLVSGKDTDYGAGNQFNTFVGHLEFRQDAIWAAVLFGSESGEVAGTDDGGTPDDDSDDAVAWGDAESGSNTGFGISASYNFGAGKGKFQYFSVDGDSFEEAATDMALGVHINLGESKVFVEYDTLDKGGDTDAQTYMRLGYNMPIATNSSVQVEYEVADDGNSQASAPRFGIVSSF